MQLNVSILQAWWEFSD